MPVDEKLLKRGQERFNIYCSVCHGYTGEGNGLVAQNDEFNVIVTSLYSELLDDTVCSITFKLEFLLHWINILGKTIVGSSLLYK